MTERKPKTVVASFDLPWESLEGVSQTFDLPWESEGLVALTLAVVLTANGIAVPPTRPEEALDPLHHHEGELLAPTMTFVALTVAVGLVLKAVKARHGE